MKIPKMILFGYGQTLVRKEQGVLIVRSWSELQRKLAELIEV